MGIKNLGKLKSGNSVASGSGTGRMRDASGKFIKNPECAYPQGRLTRKGGTLPRPDVLRAEPQPELRKKYRAAVARTGAYAKRVKELEAKLAKTGDVNAGLLSDARHNVPDRLREQDDRMTVLEEALIAERQKTQQLQAALVKSLAAEAIRVAKRRVAQDRLITRSLVVMGCLVALVAIWI